MKQELSTTVTRASLAKALGHISRIIEKRNTIPILANVLLEAKGDELTVRGTDLDLEATESVLATIAGPGSITVPAHLLYDIVRKLPDGADIALTMEKDDTQLTIRSGRSRFRLQTLPAEDFPTLESGEFLHSFELKSTDLAKLLDNAAFAMSNEATRYYLCGIYLHALMSGNALSLRAVATDGHRLARLDVDGPDGSSGMAGVILPRKAVAEISKLLEDAGVVKIAISAAKARFQIGSVTLTSKLIDGSFPDYARVVPTANDKVAILRKEEFSAVVGRVATLSSVNGAVKLAFADGNLKVSVNDPDSGAAEDSLDVEYDAAPIEVGFSPRYLQDILDQISGGRVRISFNDPGSPALIEDTDDASAVFVLMPRRF